MSASTSSTVKDSFEKPLPKVRKTNIDNTDEANLVTSNLKIFPSLHPLSKHYRAKNDAPARPVIIRNTTSETEETTKKIKTNDNTEAIVKNESSPSDLSQVPTKPISKVVETKIIKTKPVKKVVNDEPLAFDDPLVNMAQAFKLLQEQQRMEMQRQAALERKMMIQQLTQKAVHYTAMLNAIKSQENLLLNNNNQDFMYNIPAQNYQGNDISAQLIPNINHLMKICQENQHKLTTAFGNQLANQARFQRGINVNPSAGQAFQYA